MRYCPFHHLWVDWAGRQKANSQERWNTGHAYGRGPQAPCRHHEKPAVPSRACMARGHRPRPGAGFGPSETRRGTGRPIPPVQRWRKRFPAEGGGGGDGLPSNATRPPGRAPIPGEQAKAPTGVAMSPPPPHLSHWTLSALAEGTGTVRPTIHNILKRHGLEPTGTGTSRVSRDPGCGRKTHNTAGLYVNPPERAVVLSVDGKRRIQALSRTQRPLPMKAGHPRTRTHDCRRNGTACLMAAPGVATGRVVGGMAQRHRSREPSLFRPMWRRASIRRRTFMSSPATSPPRAGRGPRVAGKASPMDLPPHAGLRLPDERGGGHFLQTDAAASTERRLRIDRRLHLGGRGMAWAPQRKQGLRVPVGRETGGAWRVLEAWSSINIE